MRTITSGTKLRLGDTEVARIGLGTNRLTNTPDHVAFVRDAVAAGVSLVDSAYTYTGGQSEQTIAAALAPFPDTVVVATKGGYAPGHGDPDVLRSQIKTSLERLRTDSIELYYLHRVHPDTPLEESLATIGEYREAGKIRHIGLSQVGVDQIERARQIVPVTVVQSHYNLSERSWDDVVDYCAAEEIVFVPYFPLGSLGGRTISEIAERHGATPEQIALAWLLKRSPTTLPIPGTLSLDHLKQNLAALEIELSDDEFEALR